MTRLVFACVLLAAAATLHAHVVSMSSGDIRITGTHAHYELRMPLYEIAHVRAPERELVAHIRFGGATLVSSACHSDPAHDAYLCSADYTFASPIEKLDVDCTFPAITVPNHVHMLRAELDGKQDQAIFDSAFPRATLLFRPPTAVEIAVTQSAAGFARALGGAVPVLLLAALVLAARGPRELSAIAGMFVAGECAAAGVTARMLWQPAPRFVESAMALALAYLAVEILLFPDAGARWAIAGLLGGFQGLYFDLFIVNTGYRPEFVLAGAVAAQVSVLTVLALVLSRIGRLAKALQPVKVAAAGLLVFGMAWFFLRLRG